MYLVMKKQTRKKINIFMLVALSLTSGALLLNKPMQMAKADSEWTQDNYSVSTNNVSGTNATNTNTNTYYRRQNNTIATQGSTFNLSKLTIANQNSNNYVYVSYDNSQLMYMNSGYIITMVAKGINYNKNTTISQPINVSYTIPKSQINTEDTIFISKMYLSYTLYTYYKDDNLQIYNTYAVNSGSTLDIRDYRSYLEQNNFISVNRQIIEYTSRGDTGTNYTYTFNTTINNNVNIYKDKNAYYIALIQPIVQNPNVAVPNLVNGGIVFSNFTTTINVQTQYAPTTEVTQQVVDLPSMLWEILTMPFAFMSTAFNITLFEGTQYAINISNLFLTIFAILVFIFIMGLIIKGGQNIKG